MDLSVVIPIYNEDQNVNELHEKLSSTLKNLGKTYEIILVDDGSTDGTLKELKRLQASDPALVLVILRKNFGQTAAFAAGFDAAGGDVIITMDGDLQNDPGDIPRLLEKIGQYDIVSGWRKNRKDGLILRKIPSWAANWLISRVTGVKLHDYGCSLKAYKSEVVKNLDLYGEMHRFIPAIANLYGVSVAELEVSHHPRTRGTSKYGISRMLRVFLDLITVKFLQSFSTKPIQFFGPMGLLTGFLGFAISVYLTFEKLFYGQSIGTRPLLLLGALLIIVGVQLIGMGLLGEMLVRVYHESQNKPIYAIKTTIRSDTEKGPSTTV